jgi:Domain of Unknown Function (DUF1080)
MKNILSLFILILFSLSASAQKLHKIFDGKSFTGWKVPENNIWYKASNGILDIKSGPEKKGSILWTVKEYTNFVFQTDFIMLDGTVDSGVFLRGENDQIQIGISGSLKRDLTGSPYIPALKYPVEAKGVAQILKPKDWNTMKILLKDKTYTVWLNGKEVMTYTSENIPSSGPIGLQLHPGNDMHIQYKNIKLSEI